MVHILERYLFEATSDPDEMRAIEKNIRYELTSL